MRFFNLLSVLLISISVTSIAGADGTKMLQHPDISAKNIAFVYAGDIWVADRSGKNSRRLTSHPTREGRPQFSPDGNYIAFSASFDGNTDVYIVATSGGQPKRLTWHPGADLVEGWSSDGLSISFTSAREINHNRAGQLYHISTKGGHPVKIMEARAMDPSWSGDGKKIAYRPFRKAHEGASGWRQHRGGSTPPIWIYSPATKETVMVPHGNSSDFQPMWVKDDVFFLSDRDGSVALHGFNEKKGVWNVIASKPWDILSANAHGTSIIYDAGGELSIYDTKKKKNKKLIININPDLPQRRIQWKSVQSNIEHAALSPSGKRAIITARGDIFTVPLKDGTIRNITLSDGIRDMSGIWSKGGDKIAYLSDESGHYRLILADQTGKRTDKSFDLDKGAEYFELITFTNDDSKIIYRDAHLNLKAIDIDAGTLTTIATDPVRKGFINGSNQVSLSADDKWLAYSIIGKSFNQDLQLYNFETGDIVTLTDGMSDASHPAFSPDGKYLYFSASTNKGPSAAGIDMSTQERPYRAGIYAAVLQADGKSPLLPKSDEEELKEEDTESDDDPEVKDETKDEAKDDEKDEEKPAIDVVGLSGRIVAFPVAERNYSDINVASDGTLYFLENEQPGISIEPNGNNPATSKILRFDMKEKKAVIAKDKVITYELSHDGKMMLIMGPKNSIMTAKVGEKLDAKPLKLADLKMRVDPRKEWLQIFTDTWRMESDYFYDGNMHGLDWQAIYDQYRPLVDHVGTREDLTRLLVEMIAEVQVGHNRAYGGDGYSDKRVNVGLLASDIRFEYGKFRFHKIYTGEKWNPFFSAPLAVPGIGIKEGDYILAVNGKAFKAGDNFFAAFEGTTGKQVTLSISSNADGSEPRDAVVEPTGNERNIRLWNWIESNRAYVDKTSGGRVGYVYVPNTTTAGYTFFNRMYFTQLDKEAMIIDERSNGGGQIANYITDVLSRTYLAGYRDRDGEVYGGPAGAMYGPKVMLIDQDAGSGGDFLPYSFKHMGIGKLIGTRTWGGLIGISHNPTLVDGGTLTVPFIRLFDANGKWLAENEGIAPDIEVKLLPADVNSGVDPQLDRGISEVLEQLKTHKPVQHKKSPPIPKKLGQ